MTVSGRGSLQPLVLSLLMVMSSVSGCLSGAVGDGSVDGEVTYPSIWDRHTLEWQTNGTMSYLLEPGPHTALEVQEAFIEVDTSEVWDVGPDQLSLIHI